MSGELRYLNNYQLAKLKENEAIRLWKFQQKSCPSLGKQIKRSRLTNTGRRTKRQDYTCAKFGYENQYPDSKSSSQLIKAATKQIQFGPDEFIDVNGDVDMQDLTPQAARHASALAVAQRSESPAVTLAQLFATPKPSSSTPAAIAQASGLKSVIDQIGPKLAQQKSQIPNSALSPEGLKIAAELAKPLAASMESKLANKTPAQQQGIIGWVWNGVKNLVVSQPAVAKAAASAVKQASAKAEEIKITLDKDKLQRYNRLLDVTGPPGYYQVALKSLYGQQPNWNLPEAELSWIESQRASFKPIHDSGDIGKQMQFLTALDQEISRRRAMYAPKDLTTTGARVATNAAVSKAARTVELAQALKEASKKAADVFVASKAEQKASNQALQTTVAEQARAMPEQQAALQPIVDQQVSQLRQSKIDTAQAAQAASSLAQAAQAAVQLVQKNNNQCASFLDCETGCCFTDANGVASCRPAEDCKNAGYSNAQSLRDPYYNIGHWITKSGGARKGANQTLVDAYIAARAKGWPKHEAQQIAVASVPAPTTAAAAAQLSKTLETVVEADEDEDDVPIASTIAKLNAKRKITPPPPIRRSARLKR